MSQTKTTAGFKKLIILTPEQLLRLRGRDRELTVRSDADRRLALQRANKQATRVGPSHAYAEYRSVQDRHLHHAARERTQPLQMVLADPADSLAGSTEEDPLSKVKKEVEEEIKREVKQEKEPVVIKPEVDEPEGERKPVKPRPRKKKPVLAGKNKSRLVRRIERPTPFPSPLKTRAKHKQLLKQQLDGWLPYGAW